MITTSDAALAVGAYTVAIGAHQWEILDGRISFERSIGTTEYGTSYRQPYGIKARHREVRFVKIEDLMDDLRQLSHLAGRTGTLVKFTPDVTAPATFWWLNWPVEGTFTRIVENRTELRVRLQEQSPGA